MVTLVTKKTSRSNSLLPGGVLVGLLTLGGCQYSQIPDYCTRPTWLADLVGTWEPTSETTADIKTARYPTATNQIILYKNGTFSMLNMPDCVFSGGNGEWESPQRKLKSGSGTWQVTNFDDEGTRVWDVEFSFGTRGVGSLPTEGGPHLGWQSNSYNLRFGFGDADFGHAAYFRRK